LEPWEVAARVAIRDLVARYNAKGDAGRFDELLELFCEDGVVEIPGQPERRGREAIRGLFEGVALRTGSGGDRPARYIRHFTSTLQVDFDSHEAARGRAYYQVLTDRGLDHWGRYVDRYRLDGESWRFAERRVSVDGAVPGGWGDSGA
jgi:3-phenylpropionate/cinnamic acid dioxygenase small subunit